MTVGATSPSGPSRRVGVDRRGEGVRDDDDGGAGDGDFADGKEDVDGANDRRSAKKKSFLLVLCAVLVFVVLIIGLSVGLLVAKDKDGEEEEPRNSDLPSVLKYLAEQGFDTEGSHQLSAATWLAEIDERDLPVPSVPMTSDEGYRYISRYVLALNYFALGGSQWRNNTNFLSPMDICGWTGTRIRNLRVIREGVICDDKGEFVGLNLDSMNLTGMLPKENGRLTRLRVLEFGWNINLEGEFYEDLCQLTNMRRMGFGYTSMSATIPPCIDDLSEILRLFLSNTFLEGEVPRQMKNLETMKALYLDDCLGLRGNISDMFEGMTGLIGLFLEDNDFTGTVDSGFLKSHSRILQVDLSNNKLSGGDFTHMLDYQRLEVLDLHGNEFDAELPSIISNNTSMRFLALHDNAFNGEVSPDFKNLTKLTHLDLSNNDLSGTIPPELGELIELEYLFLGNNPGFSVGPIPTTYSNLLLLEELSLKNTNRNGELPEFIGLMNNLTFLDLDNNQLNSTIPASYGQVSNLEFIFLSRNEVSGQVPDTFQGLTDLRAVFLESNRLSGNLDVLCGLDSFRVSGGGGSSSSTSSGADVERMVVADCAGDPPPINCTCCKLCCESGAGDDCHDGYAVASLDPVWERRYERLAYGFGNGTAAGRYISDNILPPGDRRRLRSAGSEFDGR